MSRVHRGKFPVASLGLTFWEAALRGLSSSAVGCKSNNFLASKPSFIEAIERPHFAIKKFLPKEGKDIEGRTKRKQGGGREGGREGGSDGGREEGQVKQIGRRQWREHLRFKGNDIPVLVLRLFQEHGWNALCLVVKLLGGCANALTQTATGAGNAKTEQSPLSLDGPQ